MASGEEKSQVYLFGTCGSSGRGGPTQHQCDLAYKGRRVTVVNGTQRWLVPETAIYTITAQGARGGEGLFSRTQGGGAYVSAHFNLTEGESVFMMIGQEGESPCNEASDERVIEYCREGHPLGPELKGGGGGGGGGTFVYQVFGNETVVLMVAAGAGGNSRNPSLIPNEGGLMIENDRDVKSGDDGQRFFFGQSRGSGGGYRKVNGTSGGDKRNGWSIEEGGLGGATCPEAVELVGWTSNGGFGGGGGGCNSGGGGGGWLGGSASDSDSAESNGVGGTSYFSSLAKDVWNEKGNQHGDGEVEIRLKKTCKCEYMCLHSNTGDRQTCFCATNKVLASDGVSCLSPAAVPREGPNPGKLSMTSLAIGGGSLLLLIVLLLVVLIHCFRRVKRKDVPLPLFNIKPRPDAQLDALRQQLPALLEFNPNYTAYVDNQLPQVSRDKLSLISGLGQGAFGEVYRGVLSDENVTQEVAVKTLPKNSTEQSEIEFQLEAFIMSKFEHPNIVRLIGVCFERHPRYIVLELLNGGDLRKFLRASRPPPKMSQRNNEADGQLSTSCLIKLALDVAGGCRYLAEKHFIHRDIAARNCLLTCKDRRRKAKIADFGMSRDVYGSDCYRKGGRAMLPVKWMPPEAFLDGEFTSKTDVWAFGVLLWETFTFGRMPYPGRNNQDVMDLVIAGGRLEPPANTPYSVYNIMHHCWQHSPDSRPTFSNIIDALELSLKDEAATPQLDAEDVADRPRPAHPGLRKPYANSSANSSEFRALLSPSVDSAEV